ncbi:hypothetical protein [Pseudomonas sp. RIT-PI-S]|uniref:hypothetical protein n=1 Tax=Pseudomonas sp. RIT-PI-S TaxID=3035295 RepID=UPI0021DA70A2|nr:hypothetical protein [Pseudomonas sp. RIT-PI-S]
MKWRQGEACALAQALGEHLRQALQELGLDVRSRHVPDGVRTRAILDGSPALPAQKAALQRLRA